MLIRRSHRHRLRRTTALLALLLTPANLSVPFAQARNDNNLQTRVNAHALGAHGHCGVGDVVRYNDGFGPDSLYAYDALDHLTSSTNGEGNTTRFKFDGEGLLVERTEPKGSGGSFTTNYEYNPLGSLTKVIDAARREWSYNYDPDQNLLAVTDPMTHTTGYEYDSLHRLKKVTQPQSRVTTYDYDENGNITSLLDPLGQQTATIYDVLDRPQTVSYVGQGGLAPVNGPRRQLLGHDPEGNLTSVEETSAIDGSAIARSYSNSYDSRNRLETTTDALGRKVTYGYDAADNVKRVVDPDNRETTYNYDAQNRLSTVQMPGNRTASYTWKPDGLPERVSYPSGLERAYSYDNADRLTSVTNTFGAGASEQFVYGYDANSNRQSETRKLNNQTIRSISYGYDDLNRLTTALYSPNTASGRGLTGEYYNNRDFTGLKLTRLDPTVDFTWPGAATPDPKIADDTFSVRWTGKVQAQYSETYTFYVQSDEAARLYVNGQLVVDDLTDHTSHEASGTISLQAGQKYDIKLEYAENTGDAGIKLSWSSTSQAKQVVPQERLFVPEPSYTYAYDPLGNRTSESGTDFAGGPVNRTLSYDASNRLQSIAGDALGAQSFDYDANGNLKTQTQSGDTINYSYDVRNQLRRVVAGTGELASFDYDFQRRRISKTTGGIPLSYVYDGDRIIDEYGASSQLVNRYDYGADLVRGEIGGEGERFYFSDGQGSITGLASINQGAGSLAARYEYDAWGGTISSSPSLNRIGYTGQRLDSETGLMALGNGERYYSAGLAQFVQQDAFAGSLTSPQSLNRHSYVENNPVGFIDPSGHSKEDLERVKRRGKVYKRLVEDSDSSDFATALGGWWGLYQYEVTDTFTGGAVTRQDKTYTLYSEGKITSQQMFERTVFNVGIATAVLVASLYVPGASLSAQMVGFAGIAVAEKFGVESYEKAYEGRVQYSSPGEYLKTAALAAAVVGVFGTAARIDAARAEARVLAEGGSGLRSGTRQLGASARDAAKDALGSLRLVGRESKAVALNSVEAWQGSGRGVYPAGGAIGRGEGRVFEGALGSEAGESAASRSGNAAEEVTQTAESVATTEEIEVRLYRGRALGEVDPINVADPRLVVDMPFIGKGAPKTNSAGWLRDSEYYWNEILGRYPEAFSDFNRRILAGKNPNGLTSPVNDVPFRRVFPQYDVPGLRGQTLVHHHIGGGGQAFAVPKALHPGSGGIHNVEKSLGIWAGEDDIARRLQAFVNRR